MFCCCQNSGSHGHFLLSQKLVAQPPISVIYFKIEMFPVSVIAPNDTMVIHAILFNDIHPLECKNCKCSTRIIFKS